jgi:hypothetical protein
MNYQVMPDLSPQDYEALKNDIAQRDVLIPVEGAARKTDQNGLTTLNFS